MSAKTEMRLCALYVAAAFGLFADAFARGIDSVFGRVFMWLVAL